MSVKNVARVVFLLAIFTATFLALVPGPLGRIIESSALRHSLAFLVLPILAGLGWPSIGYRWLWLGFATFGGMIELAQWMMGMGRSGNLTDLLVDCVAIAAALIALHQIRQIQDRSRV